MQPARRAMQYAARSMSTLRVVYGIGGARLPAGHAWAQRGRVHPQAPADTLAAGRRPGYCRWLRCRIRSRSNLLRRRLLPVKTCGTSRNGTAVPVSAATARCERAKNDGCARSRRIRALCSLVPPVNRAEVKMAMAKPQTMCDGPEGGLLTRSEGPHTTTDPE